MADESGKALRLTVIEHSRVVKFEDIFASGFWTIAKSIDGRLFACGLNNFFQLGIIEVPSKIRGKNINLISSTFPNDTQDSTELGRATGTKVCLMAHSVSFPKTKIWTHISGVHHVVCRNSDGELYGMGNNTDNVLGIGTWQGNNDSEHWRYDKLQPIHFSNDQKIAGVTASLGTSIAWTEEGLNFWR